VCEVWQMCVMCKCVWITILIIIILIIMAIAASPSMANNQPVWDGVINGESNGNSNKW